MPDRAATSLDWKLDKQTLDDFLNRVKTPPADRYTGPGKGAGQVENATLRRTAGIRFDRTFFCNLHN